MKEFSCELEILQSLRVLQHNSMECVNEQSIETNLSSFVKPKEVLRKVEACKRGDHFSAREDRWIIPHMS